MKKTKKMDIIYEDKELLVINKPAGLLTIATEKEKNNTLYHQAREYIKKQNPNNKIFIVHRLDKDTSGIVLFAKSEKLKHMLQKNWNDYVFLREYIAIVEGRIDKNSGTIKSYLTEDKRLHTYETDSKHGKLAITNYEKLTSNKAYSLLKVTIETGRKNQIRVVFSSLNHPIIGDKKYGAIKNPIGRLGLHAIRLGICINDKKYLWTSKIPKAFNIMYEKELKMYEDNRR